MRPGKQFWFLLLLSLLTIFINLGGIPLLDPDEPVYGETPKEMILFNDYLSPRIYGEFWYDKPPMYYWLVAGAYQLFGINEFAARLPSAVLAVICVVVVYEMAAKLFDERTGIISSLVLATSLEFFYLAKAAVTDITLTLFLTVSLFCFLRRRYYLFYFFAGLATLTKGPIGVLFPGAIVIIWLALTQQLKQIRQIKIPQGILIWSIVTLPWYGAMAYIHGMDFINGFIGVNNIVRFASPEHVETSGWYFFIPVLILGFFPWSSLLVPAILKVVKARSSESCFVLNFLSVWAAFIFLFFSISNTKLVTYILPIFPALAVIVGWYINSCWDDYRLHGHRMVWPIVLTLLVLLLIGGMAKGISLVPDAAVGIIALAVVLSVMAGVVWWFLCQRKIEKAFWGQACLMAAVSVILFNVILPPIAANLHTRAVAQHFAGEYDGKSPIYVMKFLHPGFAFYANIYGKEIKTAEELSRVITDPETAYLILQQSDYQLLSNDEKERLKVVYHADDKLILLKR